MRFLVDAQLPSALARMLVELGYQAEHVADLHMASSSDTEIWNLALQKQAVVITKDEDFPQRQKQVVDAPNILWVRIGNCRRQLLLERLRPLMPEVCHLFMAGDILVEVR